MVKPTVATAGISGLPAVHPPWESPQDRDSFTQPASACSIYWSLDNQVGPLLVAVVKNLPMSVGITDSIPKSRKIPLEEETDSSL